jgi:hypothetical protein
MDFFHKKLDTNRGELPYLFSFSYLNPRLSMSQGAHWRFINANIANGFAHRNRHWRSIWDLILRSAPMFVRFVRWGFQLRTVWLDTWGFILERDHTDAISVNWHSLAWINSICIKPECMRNWPYRLKSIEITSNSFLYCQCLPPARNMPTTSILHFGY